MRSVHFLVWLSMNALASFLILFYCFLQTSADTKKSSKKLSNVRETERCTALPERPPPGSDDLWILQPSLARTCVILRLFAPLCLQSHRSWCFLVEMLSILVTVFLLVPFGFLFLLLISYFFFGFSIVFSCRPVLARKSAPRSTQSAALCQSLCVLLVCSP